MPQFCNCIQSWDAKGVEVPRIARYTYQAYNYHQVETDKDKVCVHCRHQTVFAKVHPDELQDKRYAEQQLRRRDVLPAITVENGWTQTFEKGRTVYRRRNAV